MKEKSKGVKESKKAPQKNLKEKRKKCGLRSSDCARLRRPARRTSSLAGETGLAPAGSVELTKNE